MGRYERPVGKCPTTLYVKNIALQVLVKNHNGRGGSVSTVQNVISKATYCDCLIASARTSKDPCIVNAASVNRATKSVRFTARS